MELNELSHHGIKGMKWGVRRYQNEDGSLTPAGKKRRAALDAAFDQNIKVGKDKAPISAAEKITKETQKALDNATQLSNTMSKLRRKNKNEDSIENLTNEELQSAINRMRLEDSYRELSTKRIDAGRAKVSDILGMTGNAVGIIASTVGIIATIKKLNS